MGLGVYLNVAVAGVLTGLVYGLMALGLSVIFGVVRVVNFAHGEMMSIAMYIAVVLFSAFHLDPLVMLVPIAAVMFVFGYALQAGLINPFITRPEHSQFLLVVALAIIIVNALLIIFGPDARTVQTSYAYDSFQIGPVIVDASKAYAGGCGDRRHRGAVRVLPLHAHRQGDPRLRRQLHRRAGGRAQCQPALCADLCARRRLRRRRRHDDDLDHRRDADARTGLYACSPSSSSSPAVSARCPAR